MNEKEFLKLFPYAVVYPSPDGADLRAYETKEFEWMFSTADGHLASLYFKRIHMTVFECDCLKHGRAKRALIKKLMEANGFGYNRYYA